LYARDTGIGVDVGVGICVAVDVGIGAFVGGSVNVASDTCPWLQLENTIPKTKTRIKQILIFIGSSSIYV